MALEHDLTGHTDMNPPATVMPPSSTSTAPPPPATVPAAAESHAPAAPAASTAADSAAAPIPITKPLGEVRTPLSAASVVERLNSAARRGKLAGFVASPAGSSTLFNVAAFGAPFDGVLAARAVERDGATSLLFETRLRPLMPWVFAVVLVLTVWPGVILTESLVATMIPGSAWRYTWWWYIPLSAPFVPWMFWNALKRSRASIHDSAHSAIDRIAAEIGGQRA